jgi:hypothetical protein
MDIKNIPFVEMNVSKIKLFDGHVLKWPRYCSNGNLTNKLVENKVIFWINTNLGAFYMRVQGEGPTKWSNPIG